MLPGNFQYGFKYGDKYWNTKSGSEENIQMKRDIFGLLFNNRAVGEEFF